MKYFIVKIISYDKLKNNKISLPNVTLNSIIIFFCKKENKLYGIYENKNLKPVCIKYYRRGVSLNLLPKIRINSVVKRISRNTFEKILLLLEKINYPQLSPDFLLLNKSDLTYIKTYHQPGLVKSLLNVDNEKLKLLKEKFLNAFISLREYNKIDEMKRCLFRLKKLFFHNFDFSLLKERTFIIVLTNEMFAFPFHLIFEESYTAYLTEKVFIKRDKLESFNKENTLVLPLYNKLAQPEVNISFFKKAGFDIYLKKIKSKSEIINIFSKSRLFIFYGHAIPSQKKREFCLKISDKISIYLSDLLLADDFPEGVILNCCFEFKFQNYLINFISSLLSQGTKFILLPLDKLPTSNENFVNMFIKELFKGVNISIAFYNTRNYLQNMSENYFYRFFGDPFYRI